MSATGGIRTRDLHLWYGAFEALRGIDIDIPAGRVTALIGPSGCGKSTLLRCFNRINERIPGVRTSGRVEILGHDVYGPDTDLCALRRRVGMVFQRPNPLPLSVAENVLFSSRVHGLAASEEVVHRALDAVGLWEDLKDELRRPAIGLPLEKQQKLCIARLLPMEPDVILMDEPCSALDPYATARIEELILRLREQYTVLIVTHNMAQARRVSDACAFMLLGELIEHRDTDELFLTPADPRTADYIEGRYG